MRPGICAASGLKLVYSPLNGSGLVPVTRVLKDIGITDVTIVPAVSYTHLHLHPDPGTSGAETGGHASEDPARRGAGQRVCRREGIRRGRDRAGAVIGAGDSRIVEAGRYR